MPSNSEWTLLLSDPDISKTFPKTLEEIDFLQFLNGGTNSTVKVTDRYQERNYCLKFSTSELHLKIEILLNVLYRRLGVPVLSVQAYRTIPEPLAKKLGFSNGKRTVQLSEWLESNAIQDQSLIIAQARDHFATHALFGNIDIPKLDNFILTLQKQSILVDSGANFIHRALGEPRQEPIEIVSELDTLRNVNINPSSASWFSDLSEMDIQNQVKTLIEKRNIIERTVWEITEQLEFSSSMQERLIAGFSHRLDYLAQRYGFITPHFLKRDKVAIEGKTAAGVLHLQYIDNELCVLLSKRTGHQWYDNFGGKSEAEDGSLARTAQRETHEESNGILYYSDRALATAPFHDLITQSAQGQQQVYRMYWIKAMNPIDTNQLIDHEHTEHHWVPLKNIQSALQEDKLIIEENQYSIEVQNTLEKNLILFPPLYCMLKQEPVKTILNGFLKEGLRQNKAYDAHSLVSPNAYRPLTSPQNIKTNIALTQLNKAKVLDQIKHKQHVFFTSKKRHIVTPRPVLLSQSERHLQAVMRDDFNTEASIEANVEVFLANHQTRKYSVEERTKLITEAGQMIQREKDHPEDVFFYHGVSDSIAYIYTIYQAVYQLLAADNSGHAFRTDNPLFHQCLDIQTFIAYFQNKAGNRPINNYSLGYMECALSTNLFLFGNHQEKGSDSIYYYSQNTTSTGNDIENMLLSSFESMGVNQETIRQLVTLANYFPFNGQGALYQLRIPKEDVDQYAYAATIEGRLYPFNIEQENETTRITALINALNSRQLEKKYIETVQARLMVSPNRLLIAQSYHWQTSSAMPNDFHIKLQKLAEDIVYNMIVQHNAYNKLNSKTHLMYSLSDIHRQIGLRPKDTQITDELIIQLVEAEDFESIQVLIEQHPEYKDKPLYSNQMSYNNTVKKPNSAKTLLERLLDSPNSTRIIYAIFGEHFYQDKLNELPFYQIVSHLFEQDKLPFLSSHQNQFEEMDGNTVFLILKMLPENNRLEWAKKNFSFNNQLIHKILYQLPPQDRLDYLNSHGESIFYHRNLLGKFLNMLPQCEQLAFAISYQKRDSSFMTFSALLHVLKKEDRFEFFIINLSCIDTYDQFLGVLNELPEQEQLKFVINNNDKNKTDNLLIENIVSYFRQFDEKYWLDFVIDHLITDLRKQETLTILSQLSEKGQLLFITKCKKYGLNDRKGINKDNFSIILKQLKQENELEFANMFREQIKTAVDLESVLMELDPKKRQGFVISCCDLIKTSSDLGYVLYLLPEEETFGFVKQFQYIITNIYDLKRILTHLRLNDRLDFARTCCHLIKNEKNLQQILKMLPKGDHAQMREDMDLFWNNDKHFAGSPPRL